MAKENIQDQIKQAQDRLLKLGGKVPKRGVSKFTALGKATIKSCQWFESGGTRDITEATRRIQTGIDIIDECAANNAVARIQLEAMKEIVKSLPSGTALQFNDDWNENDDGTITTNEITIKTANPLSDEQYLQRVEEAEAKRIKVLAEKKLKATKDKEKKDQAAIIKHLSEELRKAQAELIKNGLKVK